MLANLYTFYTACLCWGALSGSGLLGVLIGSSVSGALALSSLTAVVTAALGTAIMISLIQSGQDQCVRTEGHWRDD